MRHNQKGAIDLMFVLLLVAVLGVGGFVAWRVLGADETVQNTAANTESGSTVPAGQDEETNSIVTYSNEAKSYRMDIPNTWERQTFSNETLFDTQFTTENGFVTITHYDRNSEWTDLISSVDQV